METKSRGALIGAAFLMATSAIGPGFLTQTAVFTDSFKANFGFAIIVSIIIGIGAQLNIWRIICISKKRGQDIANLILNGLGHTIAFLVLFGGFAFNVGNIAGCALGTDALLGLNLKTGAAISGIIAIILFLSRELGKAMDNFTKILGFLMIFLICIVLIKIGTPIGEAVKRTFAPSIIPFLPIITMVGGTVGGYISFSGAHRLVDADITGKENLKRITNSSLSGLLITGLVRILFFLCVLGVVIMGVSLDPANPPASAFMLGSGIIGYRIFGLILWVAGITSVVGCSYTSISFFKTLSSYVEKKFSTFIIVFIVISTLIFLLIGKPVSLLIFAGAINGLILPVTLGAILLTSRNKKLFPDYKHPMWMIMYGIIALGFSIYSAWKSFEAIFSLFG
ncbi:MAG: NRAMP family divalent metal transporter [Acidobacteriota bacterium]